MYSIQGSGSKVLRSGVFPRL